MESQTPGVQPPENPKPIITSQETPSTPNPVQNTEPQKPEVSTPNPQPETILSANTLNIANPPKADHKKLYTFLGIGAAVVVLLVAAYFIINAIYAPGNPSKPSTWRKYSTQVQDSQPRLLQGQLLKNFIPE